MYHCNRKHIGTFPSNKSSSVSILFVNVKLQHKQNSYVTNSIEIQIINLQNKKKDIESYIVVILVGFCQHHKQLQIPNLTMYKQFHIKQRCNLIEKRSIVSTYTSEMCIKYSRGIRKARKPEETTTKRHNKPIENQTRCSLCGKCGWYEYVVSWQIKPVSSKILSSLHYRMTCKFHSCVYTVLYAYVCSAQHQVDISLFCIRFYNVSCNTNSTHTILEWSPN